ncbi:MAG TPA: monovalent cation/H+ antiporter subunit D [Gammaproteobacteria bacterium]
MNVIAPHLPILPIVLPLLAAGALLLVSESQRTVRRSIALASIAGQLVTALTLLYLTTDSVPEIWSRGIGVYSLGAWPAPFGIVLVVDRLSAMMLALGAIVALATLVYSMSHWDRPGQPFHPLFQLLTMGLNGAFLTGDLFNLFVFFEVLLAASYGLVLRGVGTVRVRTGLHYIAINLFASFLFLIGVALIYGTAGTLNMADLLGRVQALEADERALFDAGAWILGIAFLTKAGSWPLNSWLPGAYSVSMAPLAAGFAMMTKVGVYAVLRIGTLLGEDQAAAAILGEILYYTGIVTLVSGTIGMLATLHLRRLVSYSVIVSSGLLLASLGLGIEALTAPVLFYLATSVLTTAAFFLVAGMTDRTRLFFDAAGAEVPKAPPASSPGAVPETGTRALPGYMGFGVHEPDPYGTEEEVGTPIPIAIAFLGSMFVCCVLLVTGLPPMPSFIAKFALLSTVLETAPAAGEAGAGWGLVVAILVSGLVGIVALTRIGIRLFWTVTQRRTPRLHVLEASPVAFLVLLCLALVAASGPVMGFLQATARSLHDPGTYIESVLSARYADTGRGTQP